MFGATVMLASALSAVTIPQGVSRRMISAYPAWALRESRSSATMLEAIIEPDGSVRECKMVEFVGSERLANEECANLSRRKLRPATDADGKPVVGLLRTHVSRFVNGSRREERDAVRRWVRPADLTMVSQQSAGGVVPRETELAVLVEADGRIGLCEPKLERGESIPQASVDAACREAQKLSMAPLMTASNQPTRYVTNLYVRFEANAPG